MRIPQSGTYKTYRTHRTHQVDCMTVVPSSSPLPASAAAIPTLPRILMATNTLLSINWRIGYRAQLIDVDCFRDDRFPCSAVS